MRKREVQALETRLEEMRKERDLALAENRRIVNDRKFLVCQSGLPERLAICLVT